MDKTPEQLLQERDQRFMDTIAMKVPDRVPVFAVETYFPARYAGIPKKAAHFDPQAWYAAFEKYLLDFQPDMNTMMMTRIGSAQADQALGFLQQKYPGYGLEDNTAFQFIEGEYMRAEEYDHFIDDPTDFLLRVYLPRTHTKLEGLGMLPPLKLTIMGATGFAPLMLSPQFATMFQALNVAAIEAAKRAEAEAEFYKRTVACGFPNFCGGLTLTPFDWISDYMRGMRGTMLDMYRCPEKFLAAQEKLLDFTIGLAIMGAKMSGNPRIFIPLHRGADGFMSVKQFEQFYWPNLKKMVIDLVDAGCVPMPFFEGQYDQRLEYLREFPGGKVLCWFDRTDIFKAKEILGDKLCIAGGMPVSILGSGTQEQVITLTKQLIDKVGKGGGYIMTANTVLDEANPALVKTWIDMTKEYGVY
jgi:hypothetical protein